MDVYEKAGYRIARMWRRNAWEDRRSVDGWPSRAGMYYNDADNNLCMRLIDYAEGLTEPRHVTPDRAAVLLEGKAHINGLALHPLDVILGPSNEPHGPLVYPKGVKVFSALQAAAVDGVGGLPATAGTIGSSTNRSCRGRVAARVSRRRP